MIPLVAFILVVSNINQGNQSVTLWQLITVYQTICTAGGHPRQFLKTQRIHLVRRSSKVTVSLVGGIPYGIVPRHVVSSAFNQHGCCLSTVSTKWRKRRLILAVMLFAIRSLRYQQFFSNLYGLMHAYIENQFEFKFNILLLSSQYNDLLVRYNLVEKNRKIRLTYIRGINIDISLFRSMLCQSHGRKVNEHHFERL